MFAKESASPAGRCVTEEEIESKLALPEPQDRQVARGTPHT